MPPLQRKKPRSKESSAVFSGDCKLSSKWDQPISESQILLFLSNGGSLTLLAKRYVRPPWCFSQRLRLF